MLTPVKYVRKPLFVDAVQVTADNFNEVADWCQGEVVTEVEPKLRQFIQVRVTNPMNPRQAQAHVGDWLLYTTRGYKVYTPKAFHNSFDPVPEEDQPNGHQQELAIARATSHPDGDVVTRS